MEVLRDEHVSRTMHGTAQKQDLWVIMIFQKQGLFVLCYSNFQPNKHSKTEISKEWKCMRFSNNELFSRRAVVSSYAPVRQ